MRCARQIILDAWEFSKDSLKVANGRGLLRRNNWEGSATRAFSFCLMWFRMHRMSTPAGELRSRLQVIFCIFFLGSFSLAVLSARAQQPAPPGEPPPRPAEAAPKPGTPLPESPEPIETGSLRPHRFWDRTNVLLFVGMGVSRVFDYTSTGNVRRRGGNEILLTNEIVDNKPLFATIQLGAAAASVGTSYWLHRKGHHKLERWVSIVHIGAASVGAAHNYALKTAHRPATGF